MLNKSSVDMFNDSIQSDTMKESEFQTVDILKNHGARLSNLNNKTREAQHANLITNDSLFQPVNPGPKIDLDLNTIAFEGQGRSQQMHSTS